MEQSTAESFLADHHLVQHSSQYMTDRNVADANRRSHRSILKEKGFHPHSPILQRRGSFNDASRQPLRQFDFNTQAPRISDDDVFFSSYSRSTRTPNFEESDGRTARELSQEMENLYVRIKENDCLSRLSRRSTSRDGPRLMSQPTALRPVHLMPRRPVHSLPRRPVHSLPRRPVGHRTISSRPNVQAPIRQPAATSPFFDRWNQPPVVWVHSDARPNGSQSIGRVRFQQRQANRGV